jgi:hypothetical protein
MYKFYTNQVCPVIIIFPAQSLRATVTAVGLKLSAVYSISAISPRPENGPDLYLQPPTLDCRRECSLLIGGLPEIMEKYREIK